MHPGAVAYKLREALNRLFRLLLLALAFILLIYPIKFICYFLEERLKKVNVMLLKSALVYELDALSFKNGLAH